MRFDWISASVLSVMVMSAVGIAHAGAPGSATAERFLSIPRFCDRGPNEDKLCIDDSDCRPNGKCVIEYLRGRGTDFSGLVTIIVDDNVSKFDGTEAVSDIVAVTILFETKYRSKIHLLAQTYQNLEGVNADEVLNALREGPFIADTGASNQRVTESRLNDAITTDPSITILDDLLWQSGDSEVANELREIYGVDGDPVIVEAARKINRVEHSAHGADGLGSVAQLEVKGRFVPRR
ncbi:MAG: hypothetical protein AB7P69_02265 [Candidatus Binatia bacterium]